MAAKPEAWELAKVMFEAGKTLKDIQRETGIHFSTIGKKANSQGWEKGKNAKLILNEINVIEEKSELNLTELEFHNKEVEKLAKFADSLAVFSTKAMQRVNALVVGTDEQGMKALVDSVDKHSITIGYNKRHADPTKISQTSNTQVNLGEMSAEDLLREMKGSNERVERII